MSFDKRSSIFLALLMAIFFSLSACSETINDKQGKTMSILQDKPVFRIKLSAFGTRYDVLLNGTPIYNEDSSKAQLDTEFPVNHYMHPERNTLGVYVYPGKPGHEINPHSRVKIELIVKTSGLNNEQTIASIDFKAGEEYLKSTIERSSPDGQFSSSNNFEADDSGDVNVHPIQERLEPEYEGSFYLEREITMPNSLPLWAFFNSDTMPNYYTVSDEEYYSARKSLFEALEVIQNALAEGTEEAIDRIMPLFEERSRETDLAFYLPEGETQNGLRSDFLESIESKSQRLAELKEDYVVLHIDPNRLMIRGLRGDDGSAIGFDDSSFGGSTSFPIRFRRQNGEWIITR